MTMHMIRERVVHKSKKRPNRSPGHAAAAASHDAWLRKMGVHPDQLKSKPKSSGNTIPDYAATKSSLPTSDRIVPIAGKRKANEYTGTEIIGIGTLHKSNMVPVRADSNDAKEIARMRRG